MPILEDPILKRKISYYSRINRVVLFLQSHIDESINLRKVADVAAMERTAFSKFFRRALGITVREFVQRMRVDKAVREMSISDVSLTEVAYSSGFESLAAFERTFKKCMGMSPSAYRRKILEEREIAGAPTMSSNSRGSVLV